jgi:hypothetical protein
MRSVLAGMSLAGVLPVSAAADTDPASLDRLADIVTLPPVSWWPPAPAWYVVAGAVLVLASAAVIAQWQRRRANAYRVTALAELKRVGREPDALMRIAEILKRTALAAAPRQQVAALSGGRWVHWLNATGNGVVFSETAKTLLAGHVYGAGQPDKKQITALAKTARAWIRKHQPGVAAQPAAVQGEWSR